MFIVQVTGKQSAERSHKMVIKGLSSVTLGKLLHIQCSGLTGNKGLQVDTVLLLKSWSSNGHSLVVTTIHIDYSGPLGGRALSQYGCFTLKMVLRWPSLGGIKLVYAFSFFRSPGRQNFALIQ